MAENTYTYRTTITLNVSIVVAANDEGEAQDILDSITLQDIIDGEAYTDHWEDWEEDTDD